ncbi:hypothetical protein HaLaN_06601 [Haematococcus lacustris]|uniref:Uncharacterized protein n=1 Tax=Haematococcus lacustris TaxID=44745 RepID=A0A699YNL3_HAELA|nr:hypothetical protein HaLaN_06601 [Haematococcus lacustris]
MANCAVLRGCRSANFATDATERLTTLLLNVCRSGSDDDCMSPAVQLDKHMHSHSAADVTA